MAMIDHWQKFEDNQFKHSQVIVQTKTGGEKRENNSDQSIKAFKKFQDFSGQLLVFALVFSRCPVFFYKAEIAGYVCD